MNVTEWGKGVLLSAALAMILGFPTLVSTQMVTVLGTSDELENLEIQVVTSESTIIRQRGEQIDISFTKSGEHGILRIRNSTAAPREVRLNVLTSQDPSVLGQKITLTEGDSNFVLFDHSKMPFNKKYVLTVPARSALDLKLKVSADPGNLGYGTITLGLTY